MIPLDIESLKSQYTDKYVKVDASRPELARFRDAVGQVKTVNMSGRALVEFLNYHLNIGWFDIDLACLQVVDKPSADVTAQPEPKRAHDKPAGKAAPTSGDKQIADAAKTPAKAAGKMSVAEMMAAARANKSTGGGAPTAPAEKTAKPAAAPKAAPSGGDAPAKVDRSKMSVADMLAAARANKSSGGETASAPAAEPKPAAESKPAPSAKPSAPATTDAPEKIDRSKMSVAEMLAHARKQSGK